MEGVRTRCVLLRDLPAGGDRSDVCERLDLAHNGSFKNKYKDVKRHDSRGNEELWIVFFRSDKDANGCLEKGQWESRTKFGSCVVKPDVCQDTIIPDEWIKEKQVFGCETSEPHPSNLIASEKGDSVNSDVNASSSNDVDMNIDKIGPKKRGFKNEFNVITYDNDDLLSSIDLFGSGISRQSGITVEPSACSVASLELFGSGDESLEHSDRCTLKHTSMENSDTVEVVKAKSENSDTKHIAEPHSGMTDTTKTVGSKRDKQESSMHETEERAMECTTLNETEICTEPEFSTATIDTPPGLEHKVTEKANVACDKDSMNSHDIMTDRHSIPKRDTPLYIPSYPTQGLYMYNMFPSENTNPSGDASKQMYQCNTAISSPLYDIWRGMSAMMPVGIPTASGRVPMIMMRPVPIGPQGIVMQQLYGSASQVQLPPQQPYMQQQQWAGFRYGTYSQDPVNEETKGMSQVPNQDSPGKVPQSETLNTEVTSEGKDTSAYLTIPRIPRKKTPDLQRTISSESTDRHGYVKKDVALNSTKSDQRQRPQFISTPSTDSTDHYGYKNVEEEIEEIIYDEIDESKLESGNRLEDNRISDPSIDRPLPAIPQPDSHLARPKKAASAVMQHSKEPFEFQRRRHTQLPGTADIAETNIDNTDAAPSTKLKIFHSSGGEYSSEEKCCKIKVERIPTAVSEHTLAQFFCDPKTSGGAHIVSINLTNDIGEAIIEFMFPSVAERVLEKQKKIGCFELYGAKLRVTAYNPSPIDPNKIFISGLPDTATKEGLEMLMEENFSCTPDEVLFGETPGTALLSFDNPPDILYMKQECKKRQLDYLELSDVEATCSVRVKGYNPGSSADTLTYYFENKRKSSGGHVKSTVFQEGAGFCIVTFDMAEDAVRVCQQSSHTVDDSELTVSLYYPCLSLDPSKIVTIPDPVTLHQMDTYIVRFLMNSELYKKFVEDEIGKCYGSVVWPLPNIDTSIQIVCTVDPLDKKGKDKVSCWSEKCHNVIRKIQLGLAVNDKLNVAQEVWSSAIERIRELNVSHPQTVALFISREDLQIVVAGERIIAAELSKQIVDIVSELEHSLADEKQTITKRKIVKPFQRELLRASRFATDVRKGRCQIDLSDENNVVLQGAMSDVNDTMTKLNHALDGYVKKGVKGFNEAAVCLLYEKQMIDYIKEKMRNKKVTGVWDIRGDYLEMYGKTESEVESAIHILQGCLKQSSLPLDRDTEELIESDTGRAHIKEMKRKYGDLFIIRQRAGYLMLAIADVLFDDIYGEIDTFFNLHQVVTEFLDVEEAGRIRFIDRFKRRNIEDIEEQYKRKHVTINRVDEVYKQGFRIDGIKDSCKNAISHLQELFADVTYKNHTLTHPHIEDFIRTKDGKSELQNIEMNEICILQLDDEQDLSQENAMRSDSSESGSGGSYDEAFRKSEKETATGGATLEKNLTATVVVGELAEQDVDVLVNSTNANLDLRVGVLSKTLLKAGGDEIYQECKSKYPNGIKLGDVAVTSGGKMKCKAVYHGMLTNWDPGQGHAENVMSTFVRRCLMKADEDKHSSIAIPALGTGVLGFPADVVARLMFQCVDTLQQNSTCPHKVVFVVWKGDSKTIKAFQDEDMRRQKDVTSAVLPKVRESQYSLQRDTSTRLRSKKDHNRPRAIGPLNVYIVQGSITEEKTCMIVNSTIGDLNLDSGRVSKAILQAAGQTIQTECKSKDVKRKMKNDRFVVTDPGNLFCQKIMHVKAKNKQSDWGSVVIKCLEVAEQNGFYSISFPALGTGGKGCSPDGVARAMFEAFHRYSTSPDYKRCLKTVRIVIYQPEMLKTFVTAADDFIRKSEGIATKTWTLKGMLPRKSIKDEEKQKASVTFHIYTDSDYHACKVKTALDNLYIKRVLHTSNGVLEKLSENEISKCMKMANNRRVIAQISNSEGSIQLEGYKKAVEDAVREIDNYLHFIERDMLIAQNMSSVALPRNWSAMTLNDEAKSDLLLPADPEFVKVSTRFLTETGLSATNILTIRRIQNPILYILYIGKQRQMHSDKESKFRELWYGSNGQAVLTISETGFSRNQISGTMGVYFAVSASTIVGGASRIHCAGGSCPPNDDGQRFIFLATVVTGCCGCNQSDSLTESKDSTTDNATNPTYFVISHDKQAYPSFLVTFKL